VVTALTFVKPPEPTATLAASTTEVEVAGLLEPRYAVGGVASDYALGATPPAPQVLRCRRTVAACRHGRGSSTLAAYRTARRLGHGLFEQARQ
jgi:hypothetical protein